MPSVVQIRSSQLIPKAIRDSSRYAQHGLALPAATLRALKKRGIYCQSSDARVSATGAAICAAWR